MDAGDDRRRSDEADDRDDAPVGDDDGALVDWGANEIFLGGYGSPRDRRFH